MKNTFKYQTAVDIPELTKYLSALLEGLEGGNFILQKNEHVFSVHPRGLIDFGIKVRLKNGRARINLEMAWAEDAIELPLLSATQQKDGKL